MYVTRLLSHYKNNPESLSLPPEGPNSGYLVIQDEEAETTCFGLCKNHYLKGLPFPHNNILTSITRGVNVDSYKDVVLIPVVNQPLSSNNYYAIEPQGNHKGKGFVCLKEEQVTCRHCNNTKSIQNIADLTIKPIDSHDIYQQFKIVPQRTVKSGTMFFAAKSVAHDGLLPYFFRMKIWSIRTRNSKNYKLAEALGVNSAVRARLPDINIQVSDKSSEAVKVGMWYCPFMFIKDRTLAYQMKRSMYYEMTLEQRWEQIFECENDHMNSNVVVINAVVQTEVVRVVGTLAVWDEKNVVDKAIWFKYIDAKGDDASLGLSVEIVERMKWEEERFGWVGAEGRLARVNREEKFGGGDEGWQKFGCYVLVERFVLKRMDGSLVMTYDFKHIHQVKCIWE